MTRHRTAADILEERYGGPSRNGDGKPAAKAGSDPMPVLRRLHEVTAEPVDWLWESWLVRRAVNLLDGDPGLGKSTMSCCWAARVSRGQSLVPGRETEHVRDPAGVVLLSAEDDIARTVRPRLEAAGAELTRVVALEALKDSEDERPVVLPYDLKVVEAVAREVKAGLIVIDPLMAFLGSDIDTNRDHHVRRALHRLRLLSEAVAAAVLVLRHLNKFVGGPALYRGGGSIGLTGGPRAALCVGRDADSPGSLVLAMNKCNLAPTPRSLRYSILPAPSNPAVAVIGWGDECDLTNDDILAHPVRRKAPARDQAETWLRSLLSAGPVEADAVYEAAKKAGISDRTLERVKAALGIESVRDGFGPDGVFRWILP